MQIVKFLDNKSDSESWQFCFAVEERIKQEYEHSRKFRRRVSVALILKGYTRKVKKFFCDERFYKL